jgi:hypothetical protein
MADGRVPPLDTFLRRARFDAEDPVALGVILAELVDYGFDRLPLPGGGRTLARWRSLATVAACDLGLAKLFEGHTDALAILAELNGPAPPARSRWGMWAAEPPDARVAATALHGEQLRLSGIKAWCLGASVVSHGLLTVWLDGEPMLAAVDMRQSSSISIDASPWQAVGMRATASADVSFDRAFATRVGEPHAYVRRPGFWHGSAGVAACWYGAAAARAACGAPPECSPYRRHNIQCRVPAARDRSRTRPGRLRSSRPCVRPPAATTSPCGRRDSAIAITMLIATAAFQGLTTPTQFTPPTFAASYK